MLSRNARSPSLRGADGRGLAGPLQGRWGPYSQLGPVKGPGHVGCLACGPQNPLSRADTALAPQAVNQGVTLQILE